MSRWFYFIVFFITTSLFSALYYLSYPEELRGRFGILRFENDLDELAEFFMLKKEIKKIACYEGSVRAESFEANRGLKLGSKVEKAFLSLCQKARVDLAWKTKSDILFHYGGAGNNPHYWVSLIRPRLSEPIKECPRLSIIAVHKECIIQISKTWAISYLRVE